MNIKFIKAVRTSLYSVKATYTLDNIEFSVMWHCINAGTDKIEDFDLDCNAQSQNEDVAFRVSESIKKGEADENEDIELYLFVRETFDSNDCLSLNDYFDDIAALDLHVTDAQLHIHVTEENTLGFSINYAINDVFMIQYDPHGGFSIPDSAEAAWNNDTIQDVASQSIDADELAEFFELPSSIQDLFEKNCCPDIYGDDEAKNLLKVLL